MPDGTILIRGFPMSRLEVARIEQEIGGMLFDETVFNTQAKREACANILRELDRQLGYWQYINQTTELPPYINLKEDKTWLYIPANLFPPNAAIIMVPTPDRPAGLVAWFRIKRYFKGVKH